VATDSAVAVAVKALLQGFLVRLPTAQKLPCRVCDLCSIQHLCNDHWSPKDRSQTHDQYVCQSINQGERRRKWWGCQNTPSSAASNNLSPPQQRSNLVKHPLQNTENDCHQWLSGSFKVHQIRFRPGLWPDTAGGAYRAPPDLLAGLRGLLQRRKGKIREGRWGREGKGYGLHTATPWICLATPHLFNSPSVNSCVRACNQSTTSNLNIFSKMGWTAALSSVKYLGR